MERKHCRPKKEIAIGERYLLHWTDNCCQSNEQTARVRPFEGLIPIQWPVWPGLACWLSPFSAQSPFTRPTTIEPASTQSTVPEPDRSPVSAFTQMDAPIGTSNTNWLLKYPLFIREQLCGITNNDLTEIYKMTKKDLQIRYVQGKKREKDNKDAFEIKEGIFAGCVLILQ